MTQPDDRPNPWLGHAEPVRLPQPTYPPQPPADPWRYPPPTPSPLPVFPSPPPGPPPIYPPAPPRRGGRAWLAVGIVCALTVVGLAAWAVIKDDRSKHADPAATGQPSADATKVVTANDHKSQLTVPATWVEAPASQKNELASLQLGDDKSSQYLLVITGIPVDFDGFEAFTAACLDDMRSSTADADVGAGHPLSIGGLNAVQHEVSGKVSGFRVNYWVTMVEGKRGYFEVVGWTSPSKKDEAGPVILKAVESFRELDG